MTKLLDCAKLPDLLGSDINAFLMEEARRDMIQDAALHDLLENADQITEALFDDCEESALIDPLQNLIALRMANANNDQMARVARELADALISKAEDMAPERAKDHKYY